MLFYFRKRKAKVDNDGLKKDLKKLSKLATSLIIDQKALTLAQSEDNGYDLPKYRKVVINNLSDKESDDEQ